ncbi:hypothetical protein EYC80_004938 [Monilinia laxa]|uniref:Uncharacterized protein n=1 Tax=Monilinia laxa TaxID=61186 RepID=A0A5N6KIN3_MONLA|nr:hypothetical protein EYC80_004938 [Monilinia laxa]
MATKKYGNATSMIFNVKRDKYGLTRVFKPTSAPTPTASGWSPTGHLPPGANLETIQEEKLIEEFQRHELYNFTVRELVDLDVISSRILEEGNLANPIHPIFSRNVWEQVGQRPYDWHIQTPELTARGDMCIMHNPIISEAMTPVLTLASAFLSRMHAVPFFDALLLGPRRPMEQNSSTTRLPAGLCTFWRRTPGQTNANDFAECKKQFSVALRRLHKTIRWGFAPGTRMPWDVVPLKGSGCLGITHEGKNSDNRDTIWVFIDQKLCDLLLRDDLTSAEKAGAQYLLAIVMCHELTHALWFCIQDHKLNKHYEPFFEDAPQCELGFEMENSVFGGLIEALIPTPAAPFAYAMGCTYPNYSSLDQRVPRTIVMDKAKAYYDQSFQYFIPIQTFEDIRKQTYWDTAIRQFGFTVIHTRSIKHGWKVDFAPDWKDVNEEGRPSYKASLFARINYLQGIPLTGNGEIRVLVSKYDGKQLPPKKKASFKFIEDLIVSARQEEEFYDFTQDQEDKLWQGQDSSRPH